ncbi:MAG: hypothetical protein EOO07_33565 [Chitinophagaceae bacterium]|nr:MAG: hypothetical protein EOO07_33565 [Chitinophagaceae bacterium]
MAENKTKTKAAMLVELESIKGLLKEEDDIPILQEVIEQSRPVSTPKKRSEQQDFFNASNLVPTLDSASQLLDTLSDLERVTVEVATGKNYDVKSYDSKNADNKSSDNKTVDNKHDSNKSQSQQRPPLAKADGENPFLPQHIRSRLHGNNPPPLFEIEAARKIANISQPATQLGNTQGNQLPSKTSIFSSPKSSAPQQALIDEIMDNLLPEIERELRERLEGMTKEMLETLLKN